MFVSHTSSDGHPDTSSATRRLHGLVPTDASANDIVRNTRHPQHETSRGRSAHHARAMDPNARPSLSDLAGVRISDRPADGERAKRDRPRLAFQPFHALAAILALSCALCASLTMLVQQAVHYSVTQQAQATGPQREQSERTYVQKDKDSTGQNMSPQPQAEASQPESQLIDLNAADVSQLQTLKGVGPVTAQRIIDYRGQIGRFESVDQLMEVKGIGAKTLAKFRDQVCVR